MRQIVGAKFIFPVWPSTDINNDVYRLPVQIDFLLKMMERNKVFSFFMRLGFTKIFPFTYD